MSHATAEKLWKGAPQSPFVPKSYQKQVLKTREEGTPLSLTHSSSFTDQTIIADVITE